jgi:cyclase
VEIRNRGRANSPDDVTVYLPEEKVLFTGDILVHPVPYAMQSHPTHWASALRELEALPVSAIVPGHGPVFRDHAYTRQVRELVETALQRVTDAALRGLNNEQVQTEVKLDDLRPRFVSPQDDARLGEIWTHSIQKALTERAWACVVGYRC